VVSGFSRTNTTMFSTTDTIVAVATPPGRGGIGVVRVSGPDAARIGGELVGQSTPLEPRRAMFARILDADERSEYCLDQVVVTAFAGPRSYTGEDVVEISAHGSPVLLHRIVQRAMAAGARLAEPGEFTLRAYLNGRMDLVQAEAIADLVDAVTPLQARVAMDQLEGTLTEAIRRIDAALFDLSARLEASLDFPDEGFHFIARDHARDEIDLIQDDVGALIGQGRAGRVVREGRLVAIVGRPNAGKSSLFNALVGAARAIVTEIPGTTRDVLTERIDIDGLAITLVDTAGLREAGDAIEAEGVARARQARKVAALSVVVLDAGAALTDDDRDLAHENAAASVVVASKSDLPRQWSAADLGLPADALVEVSALSGSGLDLLRARIAAALCGQADLRDPPHISNVRHLALLDEALHALNRAKQAIADGATEELVLVDLGAARRSLEEITGHRSPDDLLAHIFSRFCVGK
jgi:tRNA modification GTPase